MGTPVGGRKQFQKRFRLPRRVTGREDYILEKCRNKRVLHVGCIGRAEGLYEELMSTSAWLHARVRSVASELVGIDNGKEAVRMLRERHGVKDVYFGDAHHLEDLQMGVFDVVLAGELLEHLPSPGLFLESAHHVLRPGGHLLITTINAFCTRRLLGVFLGLESVHEDHVAYYSHRTLRRLGEMAGYRVAEQASYRVGRKRPRLPYMLDWLSSLIAPNTSEGLICLLEEPAAPRGNHNDN